MKLTIEEWPAAPKDELIANGGYDQTSTHHENQCRIKLARQIQEV